MAFNPGKYVNTGDRFKITRPDGTIIFLKINSIGPITGGSTDTFTVDTNIHNCDFILNWHNCYSFGNGAESNSIRDDFNSPFVTPGVKVSTIFEDYKEEHRKNGLIYSGLYNSTGNINNLNQFIQAEKITKDINPTYGSIQKLYSRSTADGDLITLCEDRALRVLANKDALYNADGNMQLTATENVLGQAIPYVGEYGISKNPESFAAESYRAYFTDRQRGAVMRLSKDGLTPISNHGMKDWFKDNLKNTGKLIGSFDDKKGDYNLVISNVGYNLLSNSDFDVGGNWQTQPDDNEVSNSTLDNYVPPVITVAHIWGIDEYLNDGHMDSAHYQYGGYMGLSPLGAVSFTWSCVSYMTVTNSSTFVIADSTPLQGLFTAHPTTTEIEIFSINGHVIGQSQQATGGTGGWVISVQQSQLPGSGVPTQFVIAGTATITLSLGDTIDFTWVS